MKKTISIAVIAILFFSTKQAKAQLPSSDPAYKLVWADSFNYTNAYKIDTGKWVQKFNWNQADSVYKVWNGKGSCGCNTIGGCTTKKPIAYGKWYKPVSSPPIIPAVYPPDTTNSQVTGGYLNLYTRKETFSGNCWNWPSCTSGGSNPQCNVNNICSGTPTTCWHAQYKQFAYTTAFVMSKYQFRYGYFEIKFKLPPDTLTGSRKYVTGTAFWLFNSGNLVPGDTSTKIPWSEIDIFEIIGHNNNYTTNLHYSSHGFCPANNCYAENSQVDTFGIISGNAWHTAGCLWTNHEIISYLDGVPIKTLSNTRIKPDSMLPMPIIINISTPDACDSMSDPNAAFPYQFQIDYVKVWQIDTSACGTAQTYCNNYNPAVSKLYQSVTADGSSCVDAITNTTYASIYGTNYITLNQGFSIDGNSTVLINTIDCPTKPITYIGTPAPQLAPIQFLKKQSGNTQ